MLRSAHRHNWEREQEREVDAVLEDGEEGD